MANIDATATSLDTDANNYNISEFPRLLGLGDGANVDEIRTKADSLLSDKSASDELKTFLKSIVTRFSVQPPPRQLQNMVVINSKYQNVISAPASPFKVSDFTIYTPSTIYNTTEIKVISANIPNTFNNIISDYNNTFHIFDNLDHGYECVIKNKYYVDIEDLVSGMDHAIQTATYMASPNDMHSHESTSIKLSTAIVEVSGSSISISGDPIYNKITFPQSCMNENDHKRKTRLKYILGIEPDVWQSDSQGNFMSGAVTLPLITQLRIEIDVYNTLGVNKIMYAGNQLTVHNLPTHNIIYSCDGMGNKIVEVINNPTMPMKQILSIKQLLISNAEIRTINQAQPQTVNKNVLAQFEINIIPGPTHHIIDSKNGADIIGGHTYPGNGCNINKIHVRLLDQDNNLVSLNNINWECVLDITNSQHNI